MLALTHMARRKTSWGTILGGNYGLDGIAPYTVSDFIDEIYVDSFSRTTFAGLFTATRSTAATMVDSDGVIKWAPHNHLPDAEGMSGWNDINTASSSASGGVLTVNLPAANDYTYVATGAVAVSVGSQWSSDVEVLGTEGEEIRIRFERHAGGAYEAAEVDVTLSGGWELVELNHTFAGAQTVLRISVYRSSTHTASTVYVRKPRTYRSDLGGMENNPDTGDSYVPTEGSNVFLARRDAHAYVDGAWVEQGLLVEPAATNLVPYSEAKDGVGLKWVSSSATTTEDQGHNTFGAFSGILVEDTGANWNGIQTATFSWTSGDVISVTGYLKKGTSTTWSVRLRNGTEATETVVHGTWGSSTLTTSADAGTITNENVQYFESDTVAVVTFTVTTNSTAASGTIRLGPYSTTNDDIVVLGAQAEEGESDTSLIVTSGAAATRGADVITRDIEDDPAFTFAEVDGVEMNATTAQSGTLTNVSTPWASTQNLGQVSIASDVITYAGTTGWEAIYRNMGLTVGKKYKMVVDVVQTAGAIYFYDGVGGGQIGSSNTTETKTIYFTATNASWQAGTSNFEGTLTISVKEVDYQGTIYFEGSFENPTGISWPRVLQIDDGTEDNRISIYEYSGSVYAVTTTEESGSRSAKLPYTFGDPLKVAVSFKADSVIISVNGSTETEDVIAAVPAGLTTLRIGTDTSIHLRKGLVLMKQLRVWDETFTAAQLAGLTS